MLLGQTSAKLFADLTISIEINPTGINPTL